MTERSRYLVATLGLLVASSVPTFGEEIPANRFVEVSSLEAGGHYFSQVIFAPTAEALVSWGTQTHHDPIRTHETRHFLVDRDGWIDAFPPGQADKWAANPKQWPDWDICETAGTFYQRDGLSMPRPTSSFAQVCWDEHNRRLVFYVASMTFSYEPVRREWLEPIEQPFPGGGSVSPIAVPTPEGVVVYQHTRGRTWEDSGRMYRFVGQSAKPDTWGWEEIRIEGPERPHQREFMTIVYDQKRDRLIFLSYDPKSRQPVMWFFRMPQRRWEKNPQQPQGGVSTREAVYLPEQDAVLAYGPARDDDPVWSRVYLCETNRWVPLAIDTPRYLVHEVALEYDPSRKVAVLLWPPSFEQDIRPHLFRLDVAKLR